ncbi:chaperone modulator CbpM [Chishuiella sp.]|uniref:chaperone modulator CbpM n=1 Tax=Chishuiella sp. TaxID=1969467 RepID=UPI0028AF1CBA|nr:chaperone modulator CbpM [Chishuiella sp.]
MKNVTISVVKYCEYHKIEPKFLIDLYQNDLVILHERNQEYFIDEEDLTKVERYIEFHYNLGINIEGIEVIHHLLDQIETLQKQLK